VDSLTQIVLGASVGEAVLGKKVGNKALLWGAIAGTIPDLDVFLNFFVTDFQAQILHRGFSHSIVFAVLGALLFSWLHVRLFKKTKATQLDWRKFYFLTLVTHPLLDCHTNYGTQLFWPFEYRVAFNNIFVADPFYTVPFLLLVLIVAFLKRTNPWRKKLNYTALAISSAYMLVTIGSKFWAIQQFEKNFSAIPHEVINYQTNNTPFNPVVWSGVFETDSAYYFGDVGWFDDTQLPIPFHSIKKNFPLRKQWENHPFYRDFSFISKEFFLLHQDSAAYYFSDLRFRAMLMDEGEYPFIYTYRIPKDSLDAPPTMRSRMESRGRMNRDWQHLMLRLDGKR